LGFNFRHIVFAQNGQYVYPHVCAMI
jgi:hypothetical protein